MVKITGAGSMNSGELKSFLVNGERIGVFRKDENIFYTFVDECTHDGAPICEGDTRGDLIICPRHGAEFQMISGEVRSMPATSDLDVYKNEYRDGELYVDLDS